MTKKENDYNNASTQEAPPNGGTDDTDIDRQTVVSEAEEISETVVEIGPVNRTPSSTEETAPPSDETKPVNEAPSDHQATSDTSAEESNEATSNTSAGGSNEDASASAGEASAAPMPTDSKQPKGSKKKKKRQQELADDPNYWGYWPVFPLNHPLLNTFPTLSTIIMWLTARFLSLFDKNQPPLPQYIASELLRGIHSYITVENRRRPDNDKLKAPQELLPSQIAEILLYFENICVIDYTDGGGKREDGVLAIYQKYGENQGLYVTDEAEFHRLIRQYSYTIKPSGIDAVMRELMDRAPMCTPCSDPNLIALNNGIFDYEKKILYGFTPNLIFTSKSRVNYNPFAKNVIIHNPIDGTDWDVESWMKELFDDPAIVNLAWQILGAIIRPNVRWDKSAWFYSEKGNNGKGTLCELMRQLCGKGSYAVIPICDMGKDFMLEPLIGVSAIIVDENDVGIYLDKAANLKAIITHDVIRINRKYRKPIAFRFNGFMVQCVNELPKIKDKSESLYRRQLFIPFTKCFTGHERKYIKSDYLHRKDVLEYVLFRVLTMPNYYELDEPESCKLTLEEYKEFNDPLRQFANEVFPQFVWDVVPHKFLYDLYLGWMRENVPSGKTLGKITFLKELNLLMADSKEWEDTGKTSVRVGNKMNKPELLIKTYGLRNWANGMCYGSDDIYRPIPAPETVRGYLRKQSSNPVGTNAPGNGVDAAQNT